MVLGGEGVRVGRGGWVPKKGKSGVGWGGGREG